MQRRCAVWVASGELKTQPKPVQRKLTHECTWIMDIIMIQINQTTLTFRRIILVTSNTTTKTNGEPQTKIRPHCSHGCSANTGQTTCSTANLSEPQTSTTNTKAHSHILWLVNTQRSPLKYWHAPTQKASSSIRGDCNENCSLSFKAIQNCRVQHSEVWLST